MDAHADEEGGTPWICNNCGAEIGRYSHRTRTTGAGNRYTVNVLVVNYHGKPLAIERGIIPCECGRYYHWYDYVTLPRRVRELMGE